MSVGAMFRVDKVCSWESISLVPCSSDFSSSSSELRSSAAACSSVVASRVSCSSVLADSWVSGFVSDVVMVTVTNLLWVGDQSVARWGRCDGVRGITPALISGMLTLSTRDPEPAGIDMLPGESVSRAESSSSAEGDKESLVRLRLGEAMVQGSGVVVSEPASCRLVTRDACGVSATASRSARVVAVSSCPTVGVEVVPLTLVVEVRLSGP